MASSDEPCPSLISPDGLHWIVADGPELLVYDLSGTPRYKQFLDGILLDVVCVGTVICTLDSDGVVRWLQGHDGREEATSRGAAAAGLAAGGGRLLSYGSAGIQWLAAGAAPTDGLQQPLVGAAFSADGTRLGVALEVGPFWCLDPLSGGSWGQVSLPESATAVAWSALGCFVVLVGNQLLLIAELGDAVQGAIGLPGTGQALAVSPEGVVGAVIVGNRVVLVDLSGQQCAGHIEFRRTLKSVTFAADGRLSVALDDGDANLIDLFTGGSLRTEPHRGRRRNNWNYDSQIDVATLRGAQATAVAGDSPIAKYIGPEEGTNWLRACLVLFGVFSILCCGCSGVVALVMALQSG